MRSRSVALFCLTLLTLILAGAVGAARAQALDFQHAEYATGQLPLGVAVADFNKDGKPDLVTANAEAGTVSLLLGNGAGGFAAKADFATGNAPQSVASGDLNKDGKPDLVASSWSDYTVGVRLGDGSGGFGPRTDANMGTSMFYIQSMVIVDLDNDGKPDVATSNGTRTYSPFPPYLWQFDWSGVFIRLGNGDGSLSGSMLSFATGYGPYALAAADLNGDGRQDLVTANYHSNTVSVLLQPFAPAPCKVTLALSGLRSGVLKLGRSVTAKGKVTSASLGAKAVKLTVQRKRGTSWAKVKVVTRGLSASATYSWKYKPAARGAYRIRATVAKTATNLAAASTWRSFRVK